MASLSVQRVENGLALDSLWRTIDSRLVGDPELRAKLHRVYIGSLGNSAQQVGEMTFDDGMAVATLSVYEIGDVPKLVEEPPQGVSEIRMRCDLNICDPLTDIPQDGAGLFRALFETAIS